MIIDGLLSPDMMSTELRHDRLPQLSNQAFPGTGYAVGGRAGPSRLVATSPTAAAATFPKSAGATSARPAHKPNFQVVGAPEG